MHRLLKWMRSARLRTLSIRRCSVSAYHRANSPPASREGLLQGNDVGAAPRFRRGIEKQSKLDHWRWRQVLASLHCAPPQKQRCVRTIVLTWLSISPGYSSIDAFHEDDIAGQAQIGDGETDTCSAGERLNEQIGT